jgi:diguanylate cyclase (GGDEF)-like protein
MSTQDKSTKLLLDLGSAAERSTRNELLDRALQTSLALLDADAAVILIPSRSRADRLVLHAGGAAAALLAVPAEGSEVVRLFAAQKEALNLGEISEMPSISSLDGCPGVDTGPVLFVPVRIKRSASAYIAVYRRRGRARYTAPEVRSMLLLAAWLGASLENLRVAAGAQKLALSDPDTDVYNQRYLAQALKREFRRAGRFGQELSLVMIGIDNLEALRNQHDGLDGSTVVNDVAIALSQQVRSFDILTTWRKDRFVLMLPQTGRAGAIEAAERMRGTIESHSFPSAHEGGLTVSLGVASFPTEAATVKDLLAATERALTTANEKGGNCVVSLGTDRDVVFRLAPPEQRRAAR